MMNRHERRKRTKLGGILEIKFGRVVFDIKPGEDTSRDICYVCSKPATAWPWPECGVMAHGFATINGQFVLLCEICFNEDSPTAIARKYLNAPDMKVTEGGTYNDIDEIREIADAIKEQDGEPIN
jgi:hypothetical protein